MASPLAALASAFILLPFTARAVTMCGETVPANVSDVLQNDLVCTGAAGVTLDSHATLDLNGHVIMVTDAGAAAVYCLRNACSVLSSAVTPGELVGASATDQTGIFAYPGLTLPGAPQGRVRRLDVENVFIHDVTSGILAGESRVFLTDVNASDCQREGVYAAAIIADSVTANDNVLDGLIYSRRIRGSNITANGNTYGIRGNGPVRITELGATGNSVAGVAVFASGVTLTDGDVRGNTDWDLGTSRRPRLTNVLCDRSRDLRGGQPPGANWGVCTLD